MAVNCVLRNASLQQWRYCTNLNSGVCTGLFLKPTLAGFARSGDISDSAGSSSSGGTPSVAAGSASTAPTVPAVATATDGSLIVGSGLTAWKMKTEQLGIEDRLNGLDAVFVNQSCDHHVFSFHIGAGKMVNLCVSLTQLTE